jgi:hypothetical protein
MLGGKKLNRQGASDVAGNFAVNRLYISPLALEAISPEVSAVPHLDKFYGDMYPVARAAHRAFEDIVRP